jgi:hypothetical protein
VTTKAQLRKAASAMPEAEEGTHFGMVAFSVAGKGFASVTKDGWVQLRLPEAAVADAVERQPGAERLRRGGATIGLRVRLADINGVALNALVAEAWKHRAPARLTAAIAESAASDGDLPSAIGRPATRALHAAGVSTLDEAAGWTRGRLLDLHGVGPKAVRILDEELARRGRSLRD